jgi:hypothetical protein
VGEGDGTEDPSEAPRTFSAESLAPGEKELHRWDAPGGQGILTNLRCLLLGHPKPIHREIRWSQDLEKVWALEVVQLSSGPARQFIIRGSIVGGFVGEGPDGSGFGVVVDDTVVYAGYPAVCADIQKRIDDARASRCLELFQRIVPFAGHPP